MGETSKKCEIFTWKHQDSIRFEDQDGHVGIKLRWFLGRQTAKMVYGWKWVRIVY